MREKSAFTLIEIMLVVIIIGVLAAMIVPSFSGRGEQARVAAAQADIDGNLATALDLYELDMGSYPLTSEGLQALLLKPDAGVAGDKWQGPYLKKKQVPRDPWGKEYLYIYPGVRDPQGYDLSSLGKDGIESKDDIANWTGYDQ